MGLGFLLSASVVQNIWPKEILQKITIQKIKIKKQKRKR
jgi:hypothetical protein